MTKRIFFCFSVLMLAQLADAASFDCTKASTKVEKIICGNPMLSKLDDDLSDAFENALDINVNKNSLRQNQRDWLNNKRNICADASCVKQAYKDRINALISIARDANQPPVQIIFSSYLGGKGRDRADAIRVDSAGNAYIGGSTEGWDNFPVLNAFQDVRKGKKGGIIAKFSPEGSLLWATHLGGAKSNFQYSDYKAYNLVNGLALDDSDNLYVAGETDAVDFPVLHANQPELIGLRNSFLAKFSGEGKLLWSTFIGDLYVRDITSDHEGDVYIAATKMRHNKGGASVIVKYDKAGMQLWEKEFAGADYNTDARSIAIDGNGNIFLGGESQIDDLPKQIGDELLATGYWNPFVAKFNKDGELVWSTKIGGEKHDYLTGIDVDQSGNVYLAGKTESKDFPTINASQPDRPGKKDAFVTKFSPNGKLLWSTYLGSSGNDGASAIAVDINGYIHVTGETASTQFPTMRSLQRHKAGIVDAFVATYSSSGQLIRSTYLGGSGNGHYFDMGFSITADRDANVYVTGFAESSDFPLKNAHQTLHGGNPDIFVTKIEKLK